MTNSNSRSPDLPSLYPILYEEAVRRALSEDLGRAGDITTDAIVAQEDSAKAVIVARVPGRIAGIDIARCAFHCLDPRLEFETGIPDGADARPGDIVALVQGPARPILSAERTALNFLAHLSGIASITREIVSLVSAYPVHVVCTRKTTPGLRALEKYAVRAGGGSNHRFGLDDAVLIKDNHIAVAGGVSEAVQRVRRRAGHMVKIEVEVDIRLPESVMAIFRNEGRELLTCSYVQGVQRWPVERDTQSGLRLGKPLRVKLPFAPERMALSGDQRFLAVVGEEAGSGQLIDLDTGTAVVPRLPHSSVAYVAMSADAQWLATGGWHSERVRLWSAKTGDLIQKWDLGPGSQVFFTLDSRELIIARSEEFSFRDTQKLNVTRRLPRASGLYPGHVAFTPDGRLMALELTPGVIDLKAVATGQTVARLENPRGDTSTWMAFTPDGQLIVAAQYANTISRWDLPACRVRLKAMNLDWDWPEFPASATTPPLRASTQP